MASADAPLLFRGVTVIDVQTGRRLPNRTVVVVGTRIQRVVPNNGMRVPPGARVVDARGKYLIPGLWDMHTHAFYNFDAERPVHDPKHDVDIIFPLNIANGVTGMRELNSRVPATTVAQWKREIAAGQRVGPRFLVGIQFNGDTSESARANQKNQRGWPGMVWVTTPAEARQAVDSLQATGADQIKTYFLRPPLFWDVEAEARRIGMPVGGHSPDCHGADGKVPDECSGLIMSDSGAIIIDHGPGLPTSMGDPCGLEEFRHFDATRCAAVGQHLRRNRTWIVQTTLFGKDFWPARERERLRRYTYVTIDSSDESVSSSPTQRAPMSTADWMRLQPPLERADTVSRTMFRYLPMLVGSHGSLEMGPTGFGLHNRLATLAATSGTKPLALLQAVTINAALALRAADSLGTVTEGKLADLVLLDADPVVDIWNTQRIRAVVVNGRYYDRAALDGLLAAVEQTARAVREAPAGARTP